MDLEISSAQIKKAFSKIKEDMSDIHSRIEQLEKENKELKKNLEKDIIKTNQISNTQNNKINLVGNILSGKIHIDTCPYAKKIAIQNLEKFDDIKQALRQKYKKCSCISLV
jgi:SMC interacting uncharacterized protein involved in chromosome segregation